MHARSLQQRWGGGFSSPYLLPFGLKQAGELALPRRCLWRVLLSLLADPNIVGHRVLDDAKATEAQGHRQRRGDMRETYAFVP